MTKNKPGRKKSPYKMKVVSFYIRKEWEKEIRELIKKFKDDRSINQSN
jgi:hypothetical protein